MDDQWVSMVMGLMRNSADDISLMSNIPFLDGGQHQNADAILD